MNESISLDAPIVDIEDFQKWILYEDDSLLVLNKPGWLVCHPSKNGPWSSLVGAAKEYLQLETVHLASRLDRETSGVVLLAKHKKAASHWQKGIEFKTVRRNYLAILDGHLTDNRHVSTYLGKDPYSEVYVKQRVTENSRKAKYAETFFYPLVRRGGYTFCSVGTQTGRKHQIRIHAQWINHSLVGEKLYGKNEQIYLDFCQSGWKEEWLDLLGMCRQALHGRYLKDTDKGDCFSAPLPEDFETFLRSRMKLSFKEIQKYVSLADSLTFYDKVEN